MTDLLAAAQELQNFCELREWRSCLIGGIAVLRWGEARVTRDVDLTLLTGFTATADFVDQLLTTFPHRLSNAREFALRQRVLLITSSQGVGIDISLGAFPYEEQLVERSSKFEFAPGVNLRTCSAEDLIVLKLFASRPLDLRDAEGVAIRHRTTLAWDYIETHLTQLAEIKEDPRILEELRRLRSMDV